MVKIRDVGSFGFGLLWMFPLIFSIYYGLVYGLNLQLELYAFILFFIGIVIVLSSIMEHKTTILDILSGIGILIIVCIWIITQNTPLSSKDVVFGIMIAITALIVGILTHLGILREKKDDIIN